MVAPFASTQRIVCTAVRGGEPGLSHSNRITYKPSELLPWADPYIAGLVRKLQSEVRFERAAVVSSMASVGVLAELEPPSPSIDADWDSWDRPNWNVDSEPTE
jgi:hypothetical protein